MCINLASIGIAIIWNLLLTILFLLLLLSSLLLLPSPLPSPLSSSSSSSSSPFHRLAQIKELSLENAVSVLVGNKCDLTQQRAVTEEDARQLADQLGIHYFETSAKDSTNVKDVVEFLVDAISEKMAEVIEKNPTFVPRGVRPRPVEESEENGASGCPC